MSKLKRKEIIIGFGHPVYTERDPRNEIIKNMQKHYQKEIRIQICLK